MLSLLVAGAAWAQQLYPNELVPLFSQPPGPVWGNSGLLVDLDQDGDDDFVVIYGPGAAVVVCHASGGTLHPGIAYPLPAGLTPWKAAAGDLDGDGDQDIVVTTQGTASVLIYLNDGGGGFPSPPISTFVGTWFSYVRVGALTTTRSRTSCSTLRVHPA
jgi:hypothetical protein